MAKLVLTLNGKVVDHYFIDKPSISIGRDAGNDISIDDPLLSREHARIVSVGEDEIAEDLHSSNGTRLNGRPLVRQILQHRDVIELGSHQLCYMNSRLAGDAEFDRTMIITPLSRQADKAGDAPIVNVPAAQSSRALLAEGSITVLAGTNAHATGKSVRLDRVVTTFGTPDEQLVVLTRRPLGVFITHVEGAVLPRINQQSIGVEPRLLRDGDLIEAAGYQLKFHLEPLAGQ